MLKNTLFVATVTNSIFIRIGLLFDLKNNYVYRSVSLTKIQGPCSNLEPIESGGLRW